MVHEFQRMTRVIPPRRAQKIVRTSSHLSTAILSAIGKATSW